jgi:hypothetical protein
VYGRYLRANIALHPPDWLVFNNWFNIKQFVGLKWHLDYKWNLFDHVGDLSSFDFRNKEAFKPRQGLARCYTPSRDFPKHQGVRQHDEMATCDSTAYQSHDNVVNTLAGLAQGTGRLASDRPGFQAGSAPRVSATPVQYMDAPRVNIKKPWKYATIARHHRTREEFKLERRCYEAAFMTCAFDPDAPVVVLVVRSVLCCVGVVLLCSVALFDRRFILICPRAGDTPPPIGCRYIMGKQGASCIEACATLGGATCDSDGFYGLNSCDELRTRFVMCRTNQCIRSLGSDQPAVLVSENKCLVNRYD